MCLVSRKLAATEKSARPKLRTNVGSAVETTRTAAPSKAASRERRRKQVNDANTASRAASASLIAHTSFPPYDFSSSVFVDADLLQ